MSQLASYVALRTEAYGKIARRAYYVLDERSMRPCLLTAFETSLTATWTFLPCNLRGNAPQRRAKRVTPTRQLYVRVECFTVRRRGDGKIIRIARKYRTAGATLGSAEKRIQAVWRGVEAEMVAPPDASDSTMVSRPAILRLSPPRAISA